MDWIENDKGNWITTTASGTKLLVFHKEYEGWSWMAERKYNENKIWSEERYKDAGEAKEYLESRTAPEEEAVIPVAPIDLFNYNLESEI